MTVFRAQFVDLLEPILDDVQNDQDFRRKERIAMQFYDKTKSSQKRKETIFERAGLGDFQEKPEGQDIQESDPISGGTLEFEHRRRALRYSITQEMLDHDQFDEIVTLEQDLQIAGEDDLEVRGHLLLNNGFGTTNSGSFNATGFDGLQFFSTAHTRLDGGATQRNRPTTDVNLSWTSLADARQQFQLWNDGRGRPIIWVPTQLIVHPNDELTAKEILGSNLKPGTANNDTNVLRGELSIIVSPFITGSNDWFVKGDGTDTRWYWDVQPRTSSIRDEEIKEIVAQRKRVQGYSHGHGRWHGWYGTSGTA